MELAPRSARGVPPHRLRAVARDRAQPRADDPAAHGRQARQGRGRSSVPRRLRPRRRRARRGPRRAQHVVDPHHAPRQRPDDRLLLGRVRAAPVAADLCRRPRRARRRSLQGSERPGGAADRRRLHVPAGLFSPAHLGRRLAGRKLRAAELGRCADRTGADARRPAVHHRGAARRPLGAGRGLARPARPRHALPARHQPRRERAVGSRAVGAPLRRRSRNAHPAGDHPRHRRGARAQGARRQSRRVPPQRRTRRLRRPPAHPRSDRARRLVRRRARRDPEDDDVHHPHPGAGRARRVSVRPGREAPRRLLGHARRQPRTVPRARLVRQRRRGAVQHDRPGHPLRRLDQRGQPAARRGHARDVRADVARDPRGGAAGGGRHQRRARPDLDRRRPHRSLHAIPGSGLDRAARRPVALGGGAGDSRRGAVDRAAVAAALSLHLHPRARAPALGRGARRHPARRRRRHAARA